MVLKYLGTLFAPNQITGLSGTSEVLLAASSGILVSHANKRELLHDTTHEGCGVLFLSRNFARHRRGARVTDKTRGSCAHKLRVVTHAQLLSFENTRVAATKILVQL